MVERIKETWHQYIPGWLPILVALLWLGMQYQHIIDVQSQQGLQIEAIQRYISNDHKPHGESSLPPDFQPNLR